MKRINPLHFWYRRFVEAVGDNVVSLKPGQDTPSYIKEQLLVLEAQKWLFVREYGGANLGQCVEEFQSRFGRGFRGSSWCLMFPWYCIEEAQEQYNMCMQICSASPQALKSASTQECWKNSPDNLKLPAGSPDVRPGMLMFWEWLDAKGDPTGKGHAAVVEKSFPDDTVQTIEGNTGSGAGVVREGDGVYRRVRSRKQVGDMRPLGFLKVWG